MAYVLRRDIRNKVHGLCYNWFAGLATVIGVKYESPGKADGKPGLKVKSFVSDEYKELLELVAWHLLGRAASLRFFFPFLYRMCPSGDPSSGLLIHGWDILQVHPSRPYHGKGYVCWWTWQAENLVGSVDLGKCDRIMEKDIELSSFH